MRLHPRPVRSRLSVPLACAGALLALAGCARGVEKQFVANQAPIVRLTHAPVTPTSREQYAYRMNWIGYDPDGRVDHFIYAIDPPSLDRPDATWQATTLNEQMFHFRASIPDEPFDPRYPTASDFHTFAIRAVDDQGRQSETVYRTFFAFTAAPIVSIQTPRPSSDEVVLTPSTRIRWAGIDSDGLTGKPVKYRFRLFPQRNPDFVGQDGAPLINDFIKFATDTATVDDFRRFYAPTFDSSAHCPTCTAWDSSPADTTEARYSGLVPRQNYLFVVTGFDDAGAYDPVWSLGKNMLRFVVGYAGVQGPRITMFNEYFSYTYLVGGWFNDPSRYVRIEVPAGLPLTIHWFAEPSPGADMTGYRWVMDLDDLKDETERTGPDDLNHWSPWSLNTTSATMGPFFNNGEVHTFYLEAEDSNNLTSLGIVQFAIVRSTFDRELLFVDDSRRSPDRFAGTNLLPPVGVWPTASELDTFFYARGGKPWKHYPPGTLSPVGVFQGYRYDTLGTRGISTGIVPLSVLGRYRTVVWYVDEAGGNYTDPPSDTRVPTSSLRFMSSPGQSNTLGIYVRQGGRVWLFGGAAGYATIAGWNNGQLVTFTDPETNPNEAEIVPGRFLYEFIHWRNGMLVGTFQQARVVTNQFNGNGPSRGWQGQPDYEKLRAGIAGNMSPVLGTNVLMQPRSRSDPADAPPPLRIANTDWYQTFTGGEVIHVPTFIREDLNGPAPGGEASTMDTMFLAVGGSVSSGGPRPIMTYYHGLDYPARIQPPGAPVPLGQVVFSGFPMWYFRRAQQIVLADFVLQDIFGHARDPLPRGPAAAPARVAAAALSPAARSPASPGRDARNHQE